MLSGFWPHGLEKRVHRLQTQLALQPRSHRPVPVIFALLQLEFCTLHRLKSVPQIWHVATSNIPQTPNMRSNSRKAAANNHFPNHFYYLVIYYLRRKEYRLWWSLHAPPVLKPTTSCLITVNFTP